MKGILPGRLLGQQTAPANRFFTFHAGDESYQRPPLDAFAADLDRMSLLGARFRQYVRVELPPRGRARGRWILCTSPAR